MFNFGFLLIYFLSALFLWLVFHIRKFWRYYYLGFCLPGLSMLMNIRHFKNVAFCPLDLMSKKILDIYQTEMMTSKYSFTKIWYGPFLIVLLSNPDALQKLFQAHLHKYSNVYNMLDVYVDGRGIFHQDILPKWKTHRKIITCASLNFRAVKSYVNIFFEESMILRDKMETFAKNGQSFEPVHMMILGSLSMTVRTMCGINMKIQKNYQNHPFTMSLERAFKIIMERLIHPYLLLDIFYTLLGYKKQEVEDAKLLQDFAKNIITEIKSKIANENKTEMNIKPDIVNEEEEIQNFVEVIIRDQQNQNESSQYVMSHDDLVSEIITILAAGYDTTKTANSVILMLLALHPKIQENVYDEIQSVLGNDPDTVPTFNQLEELHLLTRVLKESLRLYPSAPVVAREAKQDIEVDGFIIPKGALLGASIISIHRDPRYWSNPNQFDPDRFLPSETAKRNPNVYLPFSTGPRNCVGYKYAMLQMKTVICTILRRYRVLPGNNCKSMDDIKFEFGITMRLLSGNEIRVEPRFE